MLLRLFSFLTIFLSLFSGVIPSIEARSYYNWPKWGCYYFSSSGKKVYVSHQYCNRNDEWSNAVYNSSTKKTYYTWPKWGCFYYGANYKKIYVDHSYCNR